MLPSVPLPSPPRIYSWSLQKSNFLSFFIAASASLASDANSLAPSSAADHLHNGHHHRDEDTRSLQGHPVLRHKDSDVSGGLGMLQYRSGDENKVVKAFITGE